MSRQVVAWRTGLFVLVGLAIALGAVVLIGSGRLFAHRVPVIAYFDNSVNGLVEGAPVKFKGVPVGQVKQIQIAFDENSIRQYIPVLLELDEKRVVSATGSQLDLDDFGFMRAQVKKGLRASLEIESIITGRLYVQLDFVENAREPEFRDRSGRYSEIPTVSTGLTEFLESISQTDLAGLAHDLGVLIRRVNSAIDQLDVHRLRDELVDTMDTFQEVVRNSDFTNAVRSLRLTADEATQFLRATRPELREFNETLAAFTQETSRTLQQAGQTLARAEAVLAPDSVPLARLQSTLEDLAEASRSVRRLADRLERNPSAVLTGRDREDLPNPFTP